MVGDQIKSNVHTLSSTGPALVIGIVLTLLGARGVANAIQNALNSVWEVPKSSRPGFPWSWLRSFGLIFVVGGGTIATTVLSGAIGGAGHVLPGFAVKIAATAVSLAANIGLFWLGFRLATANIVTWKDLRLGAIISGCAWQILQLVGGYFVGHQLAHSSSLYGTFGVVLGLIAWLYLQAEATLYAAEANVVLVRRLWPRSLAPPPHTPEDVRALRLYAEAEERDKKIPVSVAVPGDGTSPGDQGDGDEPDDQNGHSAQHPAVSESGEGTQAAKSAVSARETQGEESHDR